MQRILIVGLLLLSGCQGVVGPLERCPWAERVDDPRLSVQEQQRRARDRLALPETSANVAPKTFSP
jgi:hypothetical protein